tara:strand:- start:7745 stop:8329 length:585 start_codon:yes stop_codon:yes gene_type:complete
MYNKKAAMFGLDARIALAIFGALSVISGAALYSAIQEAKLVSLTVKMNEVVKGIESYMLDTGQDLPLTGSIFDVNALVTDPTVSGWNGPYLAYEVGTTFDSGVDGLLDSDVHSFIIRAINESWTNEASIPVCAAGQLCNLWINARKVPVNIAKAYDEKIDGTYNVDEGSIRMRNSSDSDYVYLYQKYIPILNQP